MRNHIDHLDTAALPWEPSGPPGMYVRMLNKNWDTGERTSMHRFVPDEGMTPPQSCHWHSVSEEIFVIDGHMSFDSQTWLTRQSYCFHPPFTVHGFKSAVVAETVMISRSPTPLDFNFPTPPAEPKPFTIQGPPPTRPFIYLNDAGQRAWDDIADRTGRVVAQVLRMSADAVTGEGAMLLRLLPGYHRPARPDGHAVYEEALVLEGGLLAASGPDYGVGAYWCRPPGTKLPAIDSPGGALIYLMHGGPIDLHW